VEGWLASLDPRIIDRWLVFAGVEPEAFAGPGDAETRRGEGRAAGSLVDATAAARQLSAMFG
jgi:hypothetical protein